MGGGCRGHKGEGHQCRSMRGMGGGHAGGVEILSLCRGAHGWRTRAVRASARAQMVGVGGTTGGGTATHSVFAAFHSKVSAHLHRPLVSRVIARPVHRTQRVPCRPYELATSQALHLPPGLQLRQFRMVLQEGAGGYGGTQTGQAGSRREGRRVGLAPEGRAGSWRAGLAPGGRGQLLGGASYKAARAPPRATATQTAPRSCSPSLAGLAAALALARRGDTASLLHLAGCKRLALAGWLGQHRARGHGVCGGGRGGASGGVGERWGW